MSDPKRLLESAASECSAWEADLLRAGHGDAMSASAKRALISAALGGTLAASAGATATTHAATAAKVGTSALARWMLISVLMTAVAVSGGVLLLRTAEPVTTVAPAAVGPRAELPAMPDVQVPAAASAPLAKPEPAHAPSPPRNPTAPSGVLVVPEGPAGDLAGEAALLDEAREAVARRDGAAALALLAQHGRAFPRPALADEAFVLRAEALSVQGEGARLRALALPWLASHPASPYAPRVRRAVAQASPRPVKASEEAAP